MIPLIASWPSAHLSTTHNSWETSSCAELEDNNATAAILLVQAFGAAGSTLQISIQPKGSGLSFNETKIAYVNAVVGDSPRCNKQVIMPLVDGQFEIITDSSIAAGLSTSVSVVGYWV